MDADKVDVITGDTGAIAYGVGTFASRVMATAGPAMMTAAREVKEKLFQSVAAVLEVSPTTWRSAARREPGRCPRHPGGHAAGAGRADVERRLARRHHARGHGARGSPPRRTSTRASAGYSSSVQMIVVEVDPGTGEVEILEWVVGHDCGKVINPLLVEGQVLGGIAHGLSNALYEESLYSDDGMPLTTSFLDYPIPSAREFPMIGLYDQETPSPLNPLGVKGAGEAGTLGVPAVIASAVEDALRPLGVRIPPMPLSPGRIGDLIAEAHGGAVTVAFYLHPIALDGDALVGGRPARSAHPGPPGPASGAAGTSRWPRSSTTSRACSTGPADLVGMSLGSMVAQQVAVRRPELVRSLVLACGGMRTDPAVSRQRAENTRRDGMLGTLDETLRRWFTADGARRSRPPGRRLRAAHACSPTTRP